MQWSCKNETKIYFSLVIANKLVQFFAKFFGQFLLLLFPPPAFTPLMNILIIFFIDRNASVWCKLSSSLSWQKWKFTGDKDGSPSVNIKHFPSWIKAQGILNSLSLFLGVRVSRFLLFVRNVSKIYLPFYSCSALAFKI